MRKSIILFIVVQFLFNYYLPAFSQDSSDNEADIVEEEDQLNEKVESENTKEAGEVNEVNDLKENKKEIEKTKEKGDKKVLKGHVSKVPGGTKLKIIVESPIFEETSKVDDEFTAKIAEDVVVDKNVIVPIGSTVTGKITEINLAKRLHKAGSVRIEFNNLTTPDGRQIPIVASVLTRSGLLKGRYSPKRSAIAGATIITPVVAGLGAGLAAEGSAVGAGIGALLGAIAGIGLFAFQKGNKVDIKAGDELKIELTEDVLVPQEATTQVQNEKLDSLKEETGIQEDEKDFTEKDFTEPDTHLLDTASPEKESDSEAKLESDVNNLKTIETEDQELKSNETNE